MNTEELAVRMKDFESNFSSELPPFEHVIMRLDGRAFRTYLRNLNKPFDMRFVEDMNWLTQKLCRHISGVTLAYTCSDEISLLIQTLNPQGEAWFGGKIQKMVSVAAGYASGLMSARRLGFDFPQGGIEEYEPVVFDARVYTIPTLEEVNDYFVWRQLDYRRNSVSMAAKAVFSTRELLGKSTSDRIDMLADKGIDYFEYSALVRRGVLTQKRFRSVAFNFNEPLGRQASAVAVRTFWESEEAPRFTDEDPFIMRNVSRSLAELSQEE